MKFDIYRGDIYIINFDIPAGSEQGGIRPGLVFQNDTANEHSSTFTVIPMTSRDHNPWMPTHVKLDVEGLCRESILMAEQIRTVSVKRFIKPVARADESVMSAVDMAVKIHLGMTDAPSVIHEKEYNRDDSDLKMVLCPVCAGQFRDSEKYIVRRVDPCQVIKDTCDFCNIRSGYDYIVKHKYR